MLGMESGIRYKLRSAVRQEGVASEDDARSHKSATSSTAGTGSFRGSSRGGTSRTMVRHESTVSLAAFFEELDDGTEGQSSRTNPGEPLGDACAQAGVVSGSQDQEVLISNAPETMGRRQPEQNGNSHDSGASQRELTDEQARSAQDAETMVSKVDRWNPYADSSATLLVDGQASICSAWHYGGSSPPES